MALTITGGYEFELGDELEEDFQVSLAMYKDGMMLNAYNDVYVSNEQEIEILQAVVNDLKALIKQKKDQA